MALFGKVLVANRESAIDNLIAALRDFRIDGVRHNIPALTAILDSGEFRSGDVHTALVTQILTRTAAKTADYAVRSDQPSTEEMS